MKEEEILTLRLIDVDEDKFSYYFYSSPENRGKRGVEYYRAERKILQNQIKSIFLSLKNLKEMNWELRLLVPMVSDYEDWVFVKELILNEMEDLDPNKKRFVKLGVMLEVPSIMFCVQTLEQEVDFLSIGTNDLLSNFLGKKRYQLTKEDYYEPAFYRMLYLSLKNVKKEISICGNLATYIEFINLLYFIGIRNFSVPYGIYPKIYEYFINLNDKSKFDKQILKELLLKKTKTEFKEALSSITENFVKKA
jgi:Phosphoenolpyruvate-protein kinase (PTS system EI component in bacteria)